MWVEVDGTEFKTDLMTFPNFNIGDCTYYTLLEFADAMKSNKSNEIIVIYFNLRSRPKNEYKSENFLLQLPNLPHIIAITKTKLESSNLDQVELENYHFEHVDSKLDADGVVCTSEMILKSDIIVNSGD